MNADGSLPPTARAARLVRTALPLSRSQILHRLRFLWLRRRYAARPSWPLSRARREGEGATAAHPLPVVPDLVAWPDGAEAAHARAAAFAKGEFRYLNRTHDFSAGVPWRAIPDSPLWAYQMQYLGAVPDLVRAGRGDDARALLDGWRAEFEERWDAAAWHPYPASLRLVNLLLAAGAGGGFEVLGRDAPRLLATHAAYVQRHLEHDVRGNHLLENARALVFAGRFLAGPTARRCLAAGREILAAEIPEQVLDDGGHFELSPLYHTLVMQRLLEIQALLGPDDPLVAATVAPAIARMAGWLRAVLCPDGDIPLLGDSVRGFGPPPAVLLELAGAALPPPADCVVLPDTGIGILRSPRVWVVLDAGPVCPTYLPAHGQADALTVEVWVDGAPLVGDPGVHDYTGDERAWGRSSRAHSTCTVDDRDDSEVWGSFRVGARAATGLASRAGDDQLAGSLRTHAGDVVERTVWIDRAAGDRLSIRDLAQPAAGSRACSRLHLAPGTAIESEDEQGWVVRNSAGRVRVHVDSGRPRREPGRASREFGRIEDTVMLCVDHVPWSGGAGARSIADVHFEPLDGAGD